MKFSRAIVRLLKSGSLTRKESRNLFLRFFAAPPSYAQAKTLLLLLAHKGESAEEIAGCLAALQQLEKPRRISLPNVIDTCGTGGDNSGSINVSTLAAFVIAGAGGKVAKHGNRAISSKCGSSDLMEALGVNLEASAPQMIRSLAKHNIAYFHAPAHHPVYSRVQPLRRHLKTRTLFNFLGPLANPLVLSGRLLGVSNKNHFEAFIQILQTLKVPNALVCRSHDGLDEISVYAPTDLAWIHNGRVKREVFRPQAFKLSAKKPRAGKTSVLKNKKLAVQILQNRLRGPLRNLVLVNAAAGLILCRKAKNFQEGLQLAAQSLSSGKAWEAVLNLKSAAEKP